MLQQLCNGSLGAGETLRGELNGGAVSHIIVTSSVAFAAGDQLQVISSGPHGDPIHVNNVSAEVLAQMSDAEFGFSQVGQQAADAEGPAVTWPQAAFAMAVRLGCKHLRSTGSSLRVKWTQNGSAGANIYVSAAMQRLADDHWFELQETPELHRVFRNAESVWLNCSTDLVGLETVDVTVRVDSPVGTSYCDLAEFLGATKALERVEFGGPLNVVKLWQSETGLAMPVTVSVTGANASACTLIGRTFRQHAESVALARRDVGGIEAAAVKQLDTDTARARNLTLAVRAAQLRQELQASGAGGLSEVVRMAQGQ